MVAGVVGRQAVLAEIAAFVEGDGRDPRALVIQGEAGIGKTTVVRAAVTRAAAGDLRVWQARPAAAEMELPHAALGDLLDSVDGDVLDGLEPPQRNAVAAVLGRALPSAPVDEHALARGVLEVLRRLGAGGDLLLVIDDVQWLDRPSAAALTFALRRVAPVPIRVLVAVRATPAQSAELPLGLGGWQDVGRFRIGPLSATELGAVINQRLGRRLPRPRLEALARSSGGNPMFSLELAMQERPEEPPAPTLSLALEARLRELDPGVRRVLGLTAAALQPSMSVLSRAGAAPAEIARALETGIIEVEAGSERLAFAHPLLAAAAYASLPPGERRTLHEQLADISQRAIERGHHESAAVVGRDESAAEILDEAAEEAAALGDHVGAARFLVRAAALSADEQGERAGRREALAASELLTAGDIEGAALMAERLLERLPAGALRAMTRHTLVSCRVGSRLSYEDARAELELALADAGEDRATAAIIHVTMGFDAAGTCALAASLEHLRTAQALAEECGSREIMVAARAGIGFTECMLGRGVSASALQAFQEWDGEVLWSDGYSPRMALGCARMHGTEFDEAERLLTEELHFGEARGLEQIEVVARGHLAECQLRAGRWPAALANARLALEHAEQAASSQVSVAASHVLAAVDAALGHHDVAHARAADALPRAEATGDFWFTVNHRSVLGLIALSEDRPDDAIAALEPAWRLMLDRKLGNLSMFPVAHVLAEALVAAGRLGDAASIAEALRACPVGTQPWCRAMAGRCDALAASARGEHGEARRAIAVALEAHEELPEPFEHARALHLSGRIENRARAWGAARSAFLAAHERFAVLGAGHWVAKVAADLTHLPGRRPVPSGQLTPRETEIAGLVVHGLANKQIAASLFINTTTVETHLSRIYAKLGIHSRTQLAHRLAAPADG